VRKGAVQPAYQRITETTEGGEDIAWDEMQRGVATDPVKDGNDLMARRLLDEDQAKPGRGRMIPRA